MLIYLFYIWGLFWIGIVGFLLFGDKLAFNFKNKCVGYWFISLSNWGFISINLKKKCKVKIARMCYLVVGKEKSFDGNLGYLDVEMFDDEEEGEEEGEVSKIMDENSEVTCIKKEKTDEITKEHLIKKEKSNFYKPFYITLPNSDITIWGTDTETILSGSITFKDKTGWFYIKI